MPQHRRATKRWKRFDYPVSYRENEEDVFRDARNVYSNQGVLETRNGVSRDNTTAYSGAPQSLSFFKDNSENRYLLVKDGTILYKHNTSGAHTSIKTGLTSGNKHRGLTMSDRHFISCHGDGLFQYDGTTVTQLGQAAPAAASVAVAAGGSLTDSTYAVGIAFYDSTNGFESNVAESSNVTTSGANKTIAVTSIPGTAANANIDTVYIYLKDVTNNGSYLFIAEISLGTTTYNITANATSTQTPKTTYNAPRSGGGKYMVAYGQKLAYAGNSTFPSDVFVSIANVPDAYDRADELNMSGNGPITGLGVGYYNGSDQSPYLCMFKKNSIEIYTEVTGSPEQILISSEIGCIGHDTIQLINGDVYFMSTAGWHQIRNGRLVRSKTGSLAIDQDRVSDVFTRDGYIYEINKTNYSNYFSVYYPTLRQYLTFISEGSNSSVNKAYNFELDIGGFRTYAWDYLSFTSGVAGEDANGEDVIYLAGTGGYVYTHSINETVGTDVDADGNAVAIDAFALLFWMSHDDLDASANFGPFIVRALESDTALTVKCWKDYDLQSPVNQSYDFSQAATGFILDISQLDIGTLGDGRTVVTYNGEIHTTATSLFIGFYKSVAGESMSIIEAQLDFSKNGNRN